MEGVADLLIVHTALKYLAFLHSIYSLCHVMFPNAACLDGGKTGAHVGQRLQWCASVDGEGHLYGLLVMRVHGSYARIHGQLIGQTVNGSRSTLGRVRSCPHSVML